MRIITALFAVFLLMVPTSAALADITLTISQDNETRSPMIVDEESTEDSLVKTAIVGHFLWVQIAEEADAEADNIVSVDVSDPTIVGAVITDTGTVTLIRETVCEEDMDCWDCETMGNGECGSPDDEPERTEESIDLVEEFPEVDIFALLDPADRHHLLRQY